jgi:hypothetical protein
MQKEKNRINYLLTKIIKSTNKLTGTGLCINEIVGRYQYLSLQFDHHVSVLSLDYIRGISMGKTKPVKVEQEPAETILTVSLQE